MAAPLLMLLLLCPLSLSAAPQADDEMPIEEEAVAASEPEEVEAKAPAAEGDLILMSGVWAEQACAAWNETPELTGNLGKWIQNDKDRGFKVIQIYRTDCVESERVELRLSDQDGAVTCVYGGAKETAELEPKADYVMHAMTERWVQMGAGNYGPMKAMLTGRLKFDGPMFEAMGNMGPFSSFLLLVGQVPSDALACP